MGNIVLSYVGGFVRSGLLISDVYNITETLSLLSSNTARTVLYSSDDDFLHPTSNQQCGVMCKAQRSTIHFHFHNVHVLGLLLPCPGTSDFPVFGEERGDGEGVMSRRRCRRRRRCFGGAIIIIIIVTIMVIVIVRRLVAVVVVIVVVDGREASFAAAAEHVFGRRRRRRRRWRRRLRVIVRAAAWGGRES